MKKEEIEFCVCGKDFVSDFLQASSLQEGWRFCCKNKIWICDWKTNRKENEFVSETLDLRFSREEFIRFSKLRMFQ